MCLDPETCAAAATTVDLLVPGVVVKPVLRIEAVHAEVTAAEGPV